VSGAIVAAINHSLIANMLDIGSKGLIQSRYLRLFFFAVTLKAIPKRFDNFYVLAFYM